MIFIDLENRLPTDTDIPKWIAWPPAQWAAWLAKSETLVAAMATHQAAGDTVARNALIDANGAHWGQLKDWLLALSAGKCWFSETKELFSHYDVEHFRPKKEAKTLGSEVRDGYWWLAFDYMNFRACGNVGNRKKGGWFPLKENSQFSQYDRRCEEMEIAYLLDPVDIDDVKLLAFDEEGKAVPAPKTLAWEQERVVETVLRLKLNEHEALAEARRDIWAKVTGLINQYLLAKSRCANGDNQVAKEKMRSALLKVRELTRPTAELSSVAKWCVILRQDPQLIQVAC
jgi:hypothetical protein